MPRVRKVVQGKFHPDTKKVFGTLVTDQDHQQITEIRVFGIGRPGKDKDQ